MNTAQREQESTHLHKTSRDSAQVSLFCCSEIGKISNILLFTACPFVTTVREFKFDEDAFHEAKEKRQDNKLSDYGFKYTFDGATPCLVIGNVNVSNGEGMIEKLTLYWDSYIREDSKYYHESYNDKGEREIKEDTDGGANQVEYNPQYGYPEKVRENILKKDDPKFTSDLIGFSTTTLNLNVSSFK